jgi:hypothetical protein
MFAERWHRSLQGDGKIRLKELRLTRDEVTAVEVKRLVKSFR